MAHLDWGLELVLLALLVVTLVHAIRLERALRAMRNDRMALGDAIAGFDSSAREAEAGIGRLHSVSAETAQHLAARLEQGATLNDDLTFLIERGETLADRLDSLVRAGRPIAQKAPAPPAAPVPVAPPKVRSQAERDLLQALGGGQ